MEMEPLLRCRCRRHRSRLRLPRTTMRERGRRRRRTGGCLVAARAAIAAVVAVMGRVKRGTLGERRRTGPFRRFLCLGPPASTRGAWCGCVVSIHAVFFLVGAGGDGADAIAICWC